MTISDDVRALWDEHFGRRMPESVMCDPLRPPELEALCPVPASMQPDDAVALARLYRHVMYEIYEGVVPDSLSRRAFAEQILYLYRARNFVPDAAPIALTLHSLWAEYSGDPAHTDLALEPEASVALYKSDPCAVYRNLSGYCLEDFEAACVRETLDTLPKLESARFAIRRYVPILVRVLEYCGGVLPESMLNPSARSSDPADQRALLQGLIDRTIAHTREMFMPPQTGGTSHDASS